MKRPLATAALTLAAILAAPALPSAQACPMCKLANESGEDENCQIELNARPRAYMYSILFMLSMPATLTAGFGLGFYRLWKKQQELAEVSIDPADAPEQIV
jgi:hypothetical protein